MSRAAAMAAMVAAATCSPLALRQAHRWRCGPRKVELWSTVSTGVFSTHLHGRLDSRRAGHTSRASMCAPPPYRSAHKGGNRHRDVHTCNVQYKPQSNTTGCTAHTRSPHLSLRAIECLSGRDQNSRAATAREERSHCCLIRVGHRHGPAGSHRLRCLRLTRVPRRLQEPHVSPLVTPESFW